MYQYENQSNPFGSGDMILSCIRSCAFTNNSNSSSANGLPLTYNLRDCTNLNDLVLQFIMLNRLLGHLPAKLCTFFSLFCFIVILLSDFVSSVVIHQIQPHTIYRGAVLISSTHILLAPLNNPHTWWRHAVYCTLKKRCPHSHDR